MSSESGLFWSGLAEPPPRAAQKGTKAFANGSHSTGGKAHGNQYARRLPLHGIVQTATIARPTQHPHPPPCPLSEPSTVPDIALRAALAKQALLLEGSDLPQ